MDGTKNALRLSYDLAGVTDRGAYLDAAIQSLGGIFPTDSLGWAGAHPLTHAVELRGTNGSDRAEIVDAVARSATRHPMYRSYVSSRGDIKPRRMSDIIGDRDWLNHPVYSELFVALEATRQMTIVVAPTDQNNWHGWALHRAHTDFTDAEIELATSLQPVLVAFNRLTGLTHDSSPTEHRHLTNREAEILQLVAHGFSAVEIAGILRISPLTARKHLEHVYEKLGEHNRIRAVHMAVRDGIIEG